MNRIVKTILAVTICVFLIITLFYQVIIPITDENRITYWQYDDYIDGSNVSTVTGALEIVTLDSKKFVHANGIGNATITYNSGVVESVTVNKAVLDLYMFYGQSNAAYTQPDPSKSEPIPKLGTSYYFGFSNNPIHTKNDLSVLGNCKMWSITKDDGTARIGDKYAPFGATYYEKTGHKTYFVCCASGGESIDAFQPPSGEMWIYAQTILASAYNAVDLTKYTVNVMSYIWVQGEQNKNTPVVDYIDYFMTMHDAIMGGNLGLDFKNCVISLPRSANATNPVIAQKEIANDCATVFTGCTVSDSFTVANGLMNADDMHYSPRGNNIIGVQLADYCADMYYSTPYTATERSLINVIPLILIIGLVIITIGVIVTNSKK